MNDDELIVRTGYRPKILRNVIVFRMQIPPPPSSGYNYRDDLNSIMHVAMENPDFRERYTFLKYLNLDDFSYVRCLNPATFSYITDIMIKMTDEDYAQFALRFE